MLTGVSATSSVGSVDAFATQDGVVILGDLRTGAESAILVSLTGFSATTSGLGTVDDYAGATDGWGTLDAWGEIITGDLKMQPVG